MYKTLRCAILFIALLTLSYAKAQNNIPDNSVQKVKGTGFISGLYSFNIANNNMTYSRLGAMGGYLDNWGGYAKVDFALSGTRTPNISGGITKRLATFHHKNLSTPSTLHIYFGLGYGCILNGSDWHEHDHIYNPDGTTECLPETERLVREWTSTGGLLADVGLIYRYRHLNFMLGFSFTPDLGGAISGVGQSANLSTLIGVGYAF